ncbi:MAG: hypothetical protein ABJG78_13095 [Cyclobacteriaceae bacterium]
MPCPKTTLSLVLAFITLQLFGQVPDSIPSAVLDFYGSSASSNRVNEKAPSETIQFGQLAGIWYCSGFMPDPMGKVDKVPFKAFWGWKYILDGYGVQDFFYQGKNEFLYWDYFKRDMSLTQLRVFDPTENMWKISFITSGAGEIPGGKVFGTFTAKDESGELRMESPQQNPDKLSRIIFYDIKDNSFEWRTETSTDSGKSWTVTTTLSGRRVK